MDTTILREIGKAWREFQPVRKTETIDPAIRAGEIVYEFLDSLSKQD